MFHATSVDTDSIAYDWNQETSCATPPGGLLFGHLAESTPLAGYDMSPRPASTSAVDARRPTTPRGEAASTLSTTTLPPQSQPPKTPMTFQQQAAASGGQQQAPSSVVNPWLSADMRSSTRKLVRKEELSSSARARKLERGEDIQIGRSKMEFNNMQISDHRYFRKSSRTCAKS